MTQREIANDLGLSKAQITKDYQLLKHNLEEQIDDRLLSARAELVLKHDEIYKIAMTGYAETHNTRMLEIASKELECLGRLLGQAGPAINLHAHQHNVAVTTDAVAALFQPLDPADDYAEMVAAKPLPPAEEAAELEPIEVEVETAGRDEWSQGSSAIDSNAQADEPTERKNRKVQHPLRG